MTIKTTLASLALVVMFAGQALSQQPSPPVGGPDQGAPPSMMPSPESGPPGMGSHGEGACWEDPQLKQKLQLTDEQSQKIAKIAHDHQVQDIDLRGDVEKQEVLLRSLMEADSPEKEQVFAQIDKLSQARAKLEKSHVEMLLAIRHVLTAEQAKKLRDLQHTASPPGSGVGPPEGEPPPPPGGPPEN